jgi:hypothetical protein
LTIQRNKLRYKLCVAVQTCNPRTSEAETGESGIPGQPGLHWRDGREERGSNKKEEKERGGRERGRKEVNLRVKFTF